MNVLFNFDKIKTLSYRSAKRGERCCAVLNGRRKRLSGERKGSSARMHSEREQLSLLNLRRACVIFIEMKISLKINPIPWYLTFLSVQRPPALSLVPILHSAPSTSFQPVPMLRSFFISCHGGNVYVCFSPSPLSSLPLRTHFLRGYISVVIFVFGWIMEFYLGKYGKTDYIANYVYTQWIALLEFLRPITFSETVKPACVAVASINDSTTYDGESAFISGWGYTHENQEIGKRNTFLSLCVWWIFLIAAGDSFCFFGGADAIFSPLARRAVVCVGGVDAATHVSAGRGRSGQREAEAQTTICTLA